LEQKFKSEKEPARNGCGFRSLQVPPARFQVKVKQSGRYRHATLLDT